MKKIYFSFLFLTATIVTQAQTYHDLSAANLTENWSGTGNITTNDNWSGYASIRGFRGDNITASTAVDPQTLLLPMIPVC